MKRKLVDPLEENVGIRLYMGNAEPFTGIIKHRYGDFHVNEVDKQGNVVHMKDLQPPTHHQQVRTNDDELGLKELCKLLPEPVTVDQLLTGLSVDIPDKENRTIVHQTCRKYFGDRIDTKTVDQQIVFFPGKAKQRLNFNELGGSYCHFTLYKENKDTMEALEMLAKHCHRPANTFSFAGTKDKRAITVQRVSAYKVSAQQLSGISKRLKGVKLGDFCYLPDKLELGDLKGNQFTIVLRNLEATQEQLEQGLGQLKSNGFINYFGMQRFGTRTVGTHEIGKVYLLGDYEQTIELIMQPKNDLQPELSQARQLWQETKDPIKALELFPTYCVAERAILHDFKKNGMTDFKRTVSNIPRNLRLMYLHAYQSFIWNEMASQRLELFGYEPVVGDLVAGGEHITPETIGDYTIYDVVLPLPGYSIKYPLHAIGEKYQELFKSEDWNPKDKSIHALPGDYRKILGKPIDLEWQVASYENENDVILLSDFDRLMNKTLEPINGQHKALVLKISLETSQYATMALRQVLRAETSSTHQSGLSKIHKTH